MHPTMELLDELYKVPAIRGLVASMPGYESGRSKEHDFEEFFYYWPKSNECRKYPGMTGAVEFMSARMSTRLDKAATFTVR
mgnify:CR=1 FL=1